MDKEQEETGTMAGVKILELEYALIGSIILNGWNIPKSILKKEDFTNPLNYELYNLLDEFYRENNLTDMENSPKKFDIFSSYLLNKGLLEKYRKTILLANLNGSLPASLQPFLADQIKKNSAAKQLKNLALQIAKSELDIEKVIPQIETVITEIKEKNQEIPLEEINLQSLMTTPPPEIDFVFNTLPAQSVGMLVSPGGLGKSMLTLEILTAVATGKDITEGAINVKKTGKCAYLCLEDSNIVLHNRIWNLMAFLHPDERKLLTENLSIYARKGIFELADPQGNIIQKNLDALKKIAEGRRLVVIDTLRRAHSADENSSGQMTTLLQAFEVVAQETGCAILAIHHTAKTQGSKSRGTTALYDNIRFQINLEKLSEKEAKREEISHKQLHKYVKLVHEKSNYGPIEAPKILKRIDHGVLKLRDAVDAVNF